MRLAWFTPLPPARTGIAAYSAELLPLLAGPPDPRSPIRLDSRFPIPDFVKNQIDVFVDSSLAGTTTEPGCPVFAARDFLWRNVSRPYDLVVYQLGNSPAHDYMWPYFARFPGLVVLHDAQLHHSRALALLTAGRHADYRAEFAFCHPDARPGVAEAVISATAGSLFYLWPLIRVPMECARMVAVHTPGLAALLREQYPVSEVAVVRMGVADPGDPDSAASVEAAGRVRTRLGISSDAVLFAAFGVATPEKRLPEVLRALRDVLRATPSAHLLLVGQAVDHYDVMADARGVGVADHVTVTGYVEDSDLPGYLHAADVCLALRWPTSRETSAAWLRSVAAGKPTVITDLVHTASVPAIDPRSWQGLEVWPPGGVTAGASRGPVGPIAVAIDILDEQHSLGLAMRRLSADARLRQTLGHRARQFWRAEHTLEQMATDYREVMREAAARPLPPRRGLPAHVMSDGAAHMREMLSAFGVSEDQLDWNGEAGAAPRVGP
jgi:glycosyltransferase involved in cell wall biosynthesis